MKDFIIISSVDFDREILRIVLKIKRNSLQKQDV